MKTPVGLPVTRDRDPIGKNPTNDHTGSRRLCFALLHPRNARLAPAYPHPQLDRGIQIKLLNHIVEVFLRLVAFGLKISRLPLQLFQLRFLIGKLLRVSLG
jgi:hypothetical protein